MATKKKARKTTAKRTTKKGTAKKKASSAKTTVTIELPATLAQYVRRIDKGLNTLERDLAKAQASARRQGTRLLRDASRQVGKLEHWGEVRWKRLTGTYQRDAAKLLARVEAAIGTGPARKTARKKTAKKKAAKRK